ncbi:MAG: acyl-CoA thioesterase [Phycisphaerales bacterium]|nr:acyl-CoA thioesterase [Phycisphaerales bacterium]MCB9856000.1 acyl-CoA thioesterase [Phycisphaerales bacterium]MCB9864973.1 acyl-CoA thioesterase [Phycisphaerales bacterium]
MVETPPTSCDLSIRVRYPESDPMGYLHHSKFFEYFEMGRIELLRCAGFSYRDLEEEGCFFAVVKIECRFRSPGRFDDELVLTTKMERMTRARIDHSYVLRRGDVVLCDANSTIACVDRRGKLQPIPDKIFVEIG